MSDNTNVPIKSQYSYEDIDHLIQTADLPTIPRDIDTINMLNEVEAKLQDVNVPTVGNINMPEPTTPGLSLNNKEASIPNFSTKEGIESYLEQSYVNQQINKAENPLIPFRHSSYLTNYERYYHHPSFSELKFNPFVDNEKIYNENSSWFDDTIRAGKMFSNLMYTGAVSSYRSLGDLFDDDSYLSSVDLESAREFADATRIGNSTRGGVSQFVNNLGLQFGYTAGIITSIALEELALSALTSGASVLTSPLRVAGRIAKSSANSTMIGKALKGTYGLVSSLSDVSKLKGLRESVKLGDNFVTRFVAPETVEVMKTLSTAKNAGKNISNMTMASKTFGALYRDVRSLNYALSEAKMEAGMLYDQQYSKNLEKLQKTTLDGKLSEDQINYARNNANGAAFYGLASNAMLIHVSNQFTLGTALTSYSRRLGKMLKSPGNDIFSKINAKAPIKEGKLQTDILELKKNTLSGFMESLQPLNFGKKLKKTGLYALRYSVANIAEGLQEIGQEGIAEGAQEYYDKVFDDPTLGGVNLYLATLGSGMGKQLSGHGFETFMSGFLMGGPAQVFQNILFNKLPDLQQRVFNKEAYDAYNKRKEDAENKLLDIAQGFWNTLATDQDGSLLKNIENLIVQKQISDDMADAIMKDDLFQVHNLKDFSKIMETYTLIENGGLDYFRDLINDTLQLSSKELAEAFPSSKSDVKDGKIKQRLESYLQDMDKIEANWEDINNKLINIYDESKFEEGTKEFEAERLKRLSFDRYKMIALFTKDRVRRSAERMANIYEDLETKPAFRNMSASDVVVLLSPYKLKKEVEFLKSTLESIDKNEEPELYARNEQKYKDLSAINDFYNEKVRTEEEIELDLFKRAVNQKKYENVEDYLKSKDFERDLEINTALANEYKNRKKEKGKRREIDFRKKNKLARLVNTYMSNLAKVQNDVIDDSQMFDVIRKIFDYSKLQQENSIFTNASIALGTPEILANFVDKYSKYIEQKNKTQNEQFVKSIKTLQEQNEFADFLQQVANLTDENKNTFGIYLSKENMEKYLETKDPKYLVFSNAFGFITKTSNPELFRRVEALKNNFLRLTKKETKKQVKEDEFDLDVSDDEFLEEDESLFDEVDTSEEEYEFNSDEILHLSQILKKFYNKGLEKGLTEEEFKNSKTGKKLISIYSQILFGDNLGLYTFRRYAQRILKVKPKDFLKYLKSDISVEKINNYLKLIKESNEQDKIKTLNVFEPNAGFGINEFITTQETKKEEKAKPNTTKYKGRTITENKTSDNTSFYTIENVAEETFETLEDAKTFLDDFIEENKHLGEFKMFGETMFYGKPVTIRQKGKQQKFIVITSKDVKNKKQLFLIPENKFDPDADYKTLQRKRTGITKLTKSQYKKVKVRTKKGKTSKTKTNTKKGTTNTTTKNQPRVAIDNPINIYTLRQFKDVNGVNIFKRIIRFLPQSVVDQLQIRIRKNENGGLVSKDNFNPDTKRYKDGNSNIKKKKEMYELAIIIPKTLYGALNNVIENENFFNDSNNVLGFIPGDILEYYDQDGNVIDPLDFDINDAENLINIQKSNEEGGLMRFVTNHASNLATQEKAKKIHDKSGDTIVSQEDLGINLKYSVGSYSKGAFEGVERQIDTGKYNLDGYRVIVRNIDGKLSLIKDAQSNFLIEQIPDSLVKRLLKSDSYNYLYKLPNGKIVHAPLKTQLLTEEELNELYKSIGTQIRKTINENLNKVDKKTGLQTAKSNTFNKVFNNDLSNNYFFSSPKGYNFELSVTNTGTLNLKVSKLNPQTGKYNLITESEYENTLEKVITRQKNIDGQEITVEEIFDPENIVDNVKLYLDIALKELKIETGGKISIRKSFPIDANVSKVLDVSTTTLKEDAFTNENLKLSLIDKSEIIAKIEARKNARQAKKIKEKLNKKKPDTQTEYPVLMQNLISGEARHRTLQYAQDKVKEELGENPHSIDMIEAGLRTRTTRSVQKSKNLKPGDIIIHKGTSADGTTKEFYARITEIYEWHEDGPQDPMFDQTWEREGWTEEGLDNAKRFVTGARAILFELIDDPSTTAKPTQKKSKTSGEKIGVSILNSLGYKNQNRQDNGNVRGGQDGWKIRMNIKNPKTNTHYTEKTRDDEYEARTQKVLEALKEYFGDTIKGYKVTDKNGGFYRGVDKNGKSYTAFKNLSGGDIGQADFTLYIGSAEDVEKFISDMRQNYPEIIELLTYGEQSSDNKIDDLFHGRIEGGDIGFAGYNIPESAHKKSKKYKYDLDINGKKVTIIYNPNSVNATDITIQIDGKNYRNDRYTQIDFKKNYGEDFYDLIRSAIGAELFGDYIAGSNNNFLDKILQNANLKTVKPKVKKKKAKVEKEFKFAETNEGIKKQLDDIYKKYEKALSKINYDDLKTGVSFLIKLIEDIPKKFKTYRFKNADAKESFDNLQQLKDQYITEYKNSNSADKILNENELEESDISLEVFTNWVRDNLPDVFSVEELDNLKDKLESQGIRVGAFLQYFDDVSGRVKGTIYTGEKNIHKFHEAFHGIFRLLLTDSEQAALLKVSESELRKKYGENFLSELEKFRNKAEKYKNLSDRELKNLFYEEHIADEFDKYMTDQFAPKPNNIFLRFFNWLFKKIKALVNRTINGDFKNYFERINSGYYKSANVVNNKFTHSAEKGISTVADSIIVYDSYTTVNDIIINQYLDPITAQNLVNRITASVIYKMIKIDSYISKDSEGNIQRASLKNMVFDSISQISELYDNETNSLLDTLDEDSQLEAAYILNALLTYTNTVVDAVYEKLNILQINEEEIEGRMEEIEETGLIRNTENYGVDSDMIGGWKALPADVRRYFNTILIEDVDMFGNRLITEYDNAGNPIEDRYLFTLANTAEAYNGFIKAVANTQGQEAILKKLIKYGYNNKSTKAVVDKLLLDLNVTEEDVFSEDFKIDDIENKQIFLMITKAFENFRVPYYMMHMNVLNNKTYMYSTSNRDDAHAQIDRWGSKHKGLYKTLKRNKKQRQIAVNALSLLMDVVSGELNLSEQKYVMLYDNDNSIIVKDDKQTIKDIKKTYFTKSKMQQKEVKDIYSDLSKVINDTIGISLSPLFIEYSYLENVTDFDFLDAKQEFFLDSYYGIDTIERADIDQIRKIIESYGDSDKKSYLFKGQVNGDLVTEDTESRLTKLALANAEFDETVGSSTFINAEGEMVYNHQLGTFVLKTLNSLNAIDKTTEEIKNELLEKFPILKFNHLLDSNAFAQMMQEGKIQSIRINGTKDSLLSKDVDSLTDFANTGEGTTYGSLSAQRFLTTLINAYTGLINKGNDMVESIIYKDKNGDDVEVALAPILIRVLEAANTGDMIALPVIQGVQKNEDGSTTITDEAFNTILMRLVGEFNRIQSESRSDEDAKYNQNTATGDLILGYNAKEANDGTIVFNPEGRAFKFFSAGKVLDVQEGFQQRAVVELTQKSSIVEALLNKKDEESSMVFFSSSSKQTLPIRLRNVPYEVSIKEADAKNKKAEKSVQLTIKLAERISNKNLFEDQERWMEFVQEVKDAGYLKTQKDEQSKITVDINGDIFYTDNSTLANFLNYEGFEDDKVITIDRYKVLNKEEIEEVKKLKDLAFQDKDGIVKSVKENLESIARNKKYDKVESIEDFKNILEQEDIDFETLKNLILNNINTQFISMFNVLQDFDLFKHISSDIKYEITSFHSDKISSDPQINRETIESQEMLNLISNDFQHNLFQIFMNDYVNTMAINDILLGDQALTLKDAVDMIKRAKGANAAIISVYNELTDPERGINFPVKEIEMLAFTDPKRTSKISKKDIEQADGEFYITLKTHKYLQNALGRYTETQRAAVEKLLRGEEVPYEDIYGMLDSDGRFTKGLAKLNEMLNPKKFVYYDGVTYAKMSVVVLTRELTSEKDENNNWVAKVGQEKLHNLLDKMESIEYNPDGTETNRLGAAAPISALKMLKENVQNINEITSPGKLKGNPWMKLDANFFGLQVENPSNKIEIPDPIQIKNLILHEMPDDIAGKVFFKIDGVQYNLLEFKEKYKKNKRDGLTQNYTNHKNLLFDMSPDTSFNEIQKSKQRGKITPKLKIFLDYAIESLKASASSSNVLSFFEQYKNGTKYDLNNSIVEKQFIQLFLTFWTNNVFKEKLSGDQLTLMSDFGIPVFRLVYSADKEGYPDKQITIRYEEFKELNRKLDLRIDEGNFADQDEAITKRLPGLLKSKKGPVLILDRLRHDIKEYRITGDPSDLNNWEDQEITYSEIITPPRSIEEATVLYKKLTPEQIFENYKLWLSEERYSAFEDKFTSYQKKLLSKEGFKTLSYKNEFLAKLYAETFGYDYKISNKKITFLEKPTKSLTIPQVLAKIFSVRIPSQEKHSAQNSRRIDYLPPIYGSTAIMASEMVEITGWDFDVDKIFSHFKEYYIKKTKKGETSFIEFKKFETKDKEGNIIVDFESEYEQYIEWANKEINNKKSVINKAKKLFESDQDAIKSEIKFLDKVVPWQLDKKGMKELTNAGMFKRTVQALSLLGMPRTFEEYKQYRIYKNNVPYKAALENENLDAKYSILGSKRFTESRTLYQDKNGKKSFTKKGKVVEKGIRSIATEPADLEPLQTLFKELADLLPQWHAERKDKDIDVDTLLGKFESFLNNKLGAKNIGAIVLPNVYLSIMSQIGLEVNPYSGTIMKLNGQEYFKFGEEYEKLNDSNTDIPMRTQYIISALITAMTDNAKERLAKKYGLNKSALAIAGTMISLGVPLKTAMLLTNNEIIQHLYYLKQSVPMFNFDKNLAAIIETLKDYVISKSPKGTVNKNNILGKRSLNDEELISSINLKVIDPKTDFIGSDFTQASTFFDQLKDKFDAQEFSEVKEQLIFDIAILEEYVKANKIQSYTRSVGDMIQLQNGVGNSVESILKYDESIENLSLDLSDNDFKKLLLRGKDSAKSPIIVDTRRLFTPKERKDVENASFIATYYDMYRDFRDNVLPAVALQFTEPFTQIKEIVFANLSQYIKTEDKVKVMEDLSSYLTIQAYINFAENHPIPTLKHSLGTLSNDIKYSDEKSILQLVETLKSIDSLKDNFFLNYFIIEEDKLDPDNNTGMNMIVSNTFSRIDDVQKLSLQSSLIELMTSNEVLPDDPLVSVKDLATGIVHYVMTKDALRLKYKGLASAISPIAIEPYLLSIKGMMKEMINRSTNFVNVFGLTFDEIIERFTDGYLIAYKTASNLLSKSNFRDEQILGDPKTQNIKTTKDSVDKILKNNPRNIVIAFKKIQTLNNVSISYWKDTVKSFYKNYAKSQGIKVINKPKKPKFVAIFSSSKTQTKKVQEKIAKYKKDKTNVLFVTNKKELDSWILKNKISNLHIDIMGNPSTGYLNNLLKPILGKDKPTKVKIKGQEDKMQSVFYIDTNFTFLKEGAQINRFSEFNNFKDFIQDQINEIKEILENEREYTSSVRLKDSKLQIKFKTDSLSNAQKNFLNKKDDDVNFMDAINEIFNEEFGYNPITHIKQGQTVADENTGVYLVQQEEDKLKLIVNPFKISLLEKDKKYFGYLPKTKQGSAKLDNRIEQTKNKGFEIIEKEVIDSGKKKRLKQFKFPLYKLVIVSTFEDGRSVRKYKYFKLKTQKETRLGTKPAVLSYYSSKSKDTRTLNEKNPFIEGYYAEYEEVDAMGSVADTPIAFMFSNLPTTKEIKEFVDSKFDMEYEDNYELIEDDFFDIDEQSDDFDIIDDESSDLEYDIDEVEDNESDKIINDSLKKSNDQKKLDKLVNDETYMYKVFLNNSAVRDVLGLSKGSQSITKKTLPKYILSYAKSNDLSVDDVIEEINCVI